jgi:hypothetical protein
MQFRDHPSAVLIFLFSCGVHIFYFEGGGGRAYNTSLNESKQSDISFTNFDAVNFRYAPSPRVLDDCKTQY